MINQFVAFAPAPGANTLTAAEYLDSALSVLRSDGFVSGEASSEQVNTVLRQATTMASAVGQFIADHSGSDALDNGDPAGLAALLLAAITTAVSAGGGGFFTGAVCWQLHPTIEAGWLELNGQPVSRTGATAGLFAKYGETYGPGNGTTTFNLPDMRGEFPRGWDHGRGIDPGRTLGSAQDDEFESHYHTGFMGQAATNSSTGGTGGDNPYVGTTGLAGGSETRPRNVAGIFVVKM